MAREIAHKAALAALIVAGSTAAAIAQPRMNRGPNPDAPRLMVSACRTTDKVLATLCADKLRSEIEGDVSFRVLYVSPKADVENTLTQSGYDPAVALAPADAVALARQIHADMYIDATVEKTAAGHKLTANVVLARDANMAQPLGTFEHARLENVVSQISRAFQEVFNRTFTDSKECFQFERERKYAEASRRVTDGMKDYPKSTWLRYCNLALMKSQKTPSVQVAKLAEEIVEIDPMSKLALRDLVALYDNMGEKEKKVTVLEKLLAADPNDVKLLTDIVNELAGMGQFDKALPIARRAVAANQGDMNLIRSYWLILNAKSLWKDVIETGKLMATMDTSAADSTYFFRMMAAANADSNFKQAAEFADQGGIKFPKGGFNGYAVGLWRKAGDGTKSVVAARRALAADPKQKDVRSGIAAALLAENPPKVDDAIALAKEMIAAGEDKNQIAGVAVQAGNTLRAQADSMPARGADAATVQAANERAYGVLAWADTLAKGTTLEQTAKFVLGVAAMTVGRGYLTTGGDIAKKVVDEVRAMRPVPDAARQRAILDPEFVKACAQVAKADEYLKIAQLTVPAGARSNPAAAQQVMATMQQLNQYVDQMNRAYCSRLPGRPGSRSPR